MNYTLCMIKGCNNLTTNTLSEYGTYCFQHSNFTIEPQKRENMRISNNLSSITISLGRMDKPLESAVIYESSSKKERKVKSATRKIPIVLDSHKFGKTKENTMSCCICETEDFISNKMKCGHLLCEDCLDQVRTMKCPVCCCKLEGVLMKPDIIKEIELRYKEDIEERGKEDETMTYLASLGYNPNSLY